MEFIRSQLRNQLQSGTHISREGLFAFYKQFEPDLKQATFRWRIHDLKQKKLITAASKNTFSTTFQPVFQPTIKRSEEKVFSLVQKAFDGLRLCVWSTEVVHEFMLHLPNRPMTILEVDKEALSSVYHFLKDQKYTVFLQPDRRELQRYVFDSKSPIILLPLITKAPLSKSGKIVSASLEKMIVDLFCEKEIYEAFQGTELVHIINSACSKYAIDITRLLNYAERRRRRILLHDFLNEKTSLSTDF
jgi:hypothetical protein